MDQRQGTEELPFTTLDLQQSIQALRQDSSGEKSDHHSAVLHKAEKLRIVLIGVKEGGEIKRHQANGPITVHVLEGSIRFLTDAGSAELSQGQVLTLPPNVPHSVEATKESFFLLTLVPGSA